jgi:hypothetical protein
MKLTKKTCSCSVFRIFAGKSLSGDRGIWINLWGNSEGPIAFSDREIERVAESFTQAAQWLKNQGKAYIGIKKC